jgi:ABC-2 type transport system ATP-binding protein
MDEAEHCHRLAFIQRGKLIACGSPEEIKREMMHGQVLEISPSDTEGAIKVLRAARSSGRLPLTEVEMYGSLVHVVISGVEEPSKVVESELIRASINPGQIVIIEPSLEDVFIACMR